MDSETQPQPPRRRVTPPPSSPFDGLHREAWGAGKLSSTNIPPEIIDNILTNLPPAKIADCARVSKRWYLAAMPHLFKTVTLTRYFRLKGPGHDMTDFNAGPRPRFRRKWMSRHCTTLNVPNHNARFCGCIVGKAEDEEAFFFADMSMSLPPLPNLHTLCLQFDIHSDVGLVRGTRSCGFHNLRPRHLVVSDYGIFGRYPTVPTASRFPDASLDAVTVLLMHHHHSIPPEGGGSGYRHLASLFAETWYLDAVKPTGQVTVVNRNFGHSVELTPNPYIVHPTHFNWTDPSPYNLTAYWWRSGLSLNASQPLSAVPFLGAVAVASMLKGRPRIRLVGFEDLLKTKEMGQWLRWHFSTFARALLAEWVCRKESAGPTFTWGEEKKAVTAEQIKKASEASVASAEDNLVVFELRGSWSKSGQAEAALSDGGAIVRWGVRPGPTPDRHEFADPTDELYWLG